MTDALWQEFDDDDAAFDAAVDEVMSSLGLEHYPALRIVGAMVNLSPATVAQWAVDAVTCLASCSGVSDPVEALQRITRIAEVLNER